MPDAFDPLYTWLGIAPDEQPADYYRLLGLKRFETNREVISHAADQRMAHVRSFQQGRHAAQSQQVLNDLAKAAGCLLNPRRKAMYDTHLRSTSQTAELELPDLSPTTTESRGLEAVRPAIRIPAQPAIRPLPPSRRMTRAGKAARPTRWWWGGGTTCALGILASAVWMLAPGSLPPRMPPAHVAGGPSELAAAPPVESAPARATVVPTGKQDSTPFDVASAGAATPVATDPERLASHVAAPAAASEPRDGRSSTTQSSSTPRTPVRPAEAQSPSRAAPLADPGPWSLRFEGREGIEIPGSRDLIRWSDAWTVEMWLRFADDESAGWLCGNLVIGPNHAEVAGGTVAGWQAIVQPTSGGRHRIVISTAAGYGGDFPVASAAWHHLAFASDGQRVTAFVDGQRIASGSLAPLAAAHVASPIDLYVGWHPFLHANQPAGFRGDLRAFRISSKCRYQQPFIPELDWKVDGGTQLLWDFDTAGTATIADRTDNQLAGKLNGPRWVPWDSASFVNLASRRPGSPAVAAPSPASTGSPPAGAAMSLAAANLEARPPVPAQAQQDEARAQLERVAGDDIRQAKEPRRMLEVADRLLAMAAESQDDLAGRFVMLTEAQRLAATSGDVDKALAIVADLDRLFETDRSARQASVLQAVAETVQTPADRRRLAQAALTVTDELILAGRLDLAGEACQLAVTQAGRARDAELGRLAREVRDDLNITRRQWNDAAAARDALATDPDNQELHLRWGRFACFRQRNWEEGLPHLQRGSDERLASLTRQDGENPATAEQQSALGLAWLAMAKQLEPTERAAALLRAQKWLQQAMSQLTGLAKADVEKQLKDLDKELPLRLRGTSLRPVATAIQPPREFLGLLGRVQSNGVDANLLWKYEPGLRIADANVSEILSQIKVARGQVRLEFVGYLSVPASMTVNVSHAGGSASSTLKLEVDRKPIGEIGGTRATNDVYKLPLNPGEHALRWTISGQDIGACSLAFTNANTGERLTVFHTTPLLDSVRNTPTRARLTVNMIRSP